MSLEPTITTTPGAIRLRFGESQMPFGTNTAVERYLRDRGFSFGPLQSGEPRGVMFGTFDIRKWRTLGPGAVAALHGRMTGDMRRGPIEVTLGASAPADARDAFLGAPASQRIQEMVTAAMFVICVPFAGSVFGWSLLQLVLA